MVDIVLKQVLHGRRQFVAWAVPLSRETNATLVVCYTCQTRLPSTQFLIFKNWRLSAGRKVGMTPDQHGPWCLGLHAWYNGHDNGSRRGNPEPILQTWPKFGLRAATRPHEVGIASNRRSAILRWICSRVLYSPPVKSRELEAPKGRASHGLRWIQWQGLSRNKARLAEAGRGLFQRSCLFYIKRV